MRKFILFAALLFATLLPAYAGRSCEPHKPTVQSITRGLTLAQRTHEALERQYAADGTQVMLLARAGQDLGKYGLNYSHMGIVYRTVDAQGNASWRVLHKLNQCGTADAAIYLQGLGEFFLDDPWRYETAWVVPSREMQLRLLSLAQGPQAVRLNQRAYSIVSYAWGTRYQQSNQWAIETIAAAMDPMVDTRTKAQAWLRLQGYVPTTLILGPLTRLGGRLTAANVAFDDHPPEKRFSDRIETVTVDSVFAWLQRAGLAGPPTVLRL